jgi:cellulose biosynthesis protein BcsQ
VNIVAVYNIKGGVGKTSTSVNIAHLAAQEGFRVLLWDLDPQAATTYYFRIKPRIRGSGKKLILGKVDLDEQIKGSDYENLDLLPADFSYRKMDVTLGEVKRPAEQLEKLLTPLSCEFDLVVLDCPPSISLVSESIFHAASALLIPTIPTTLSQRTYQQLLEFLAKNGLNKVRLLPFFSMADRRKSMHVEMMKTLPEEYPEFLEEWIPYASDVERMGTRREPVTASGPSSAAARAYRRLWTEVSGKLALNLG